MKEKSEFKQALALPASDKNCMQAASAQILAIKFCLRPKVVYDWAEKHRVDFTDNKIFSRLNDCKTSELVMLVLNDAPYEPSQH